MPRPSPKTSSIYAPFWLKLKKDKFLAVRAPVEGFNTLIKGIKKRKDKDKKFKDLNSIDPCKLEIVRKPEDGLVIFFLKQTVGISNIIVPEEIEKLAETVTLKDI